MVYRRLGDFVPTILIIDADSVAISLLSSKTTLDLMWVIISHVMGFVTPNIVGVAMGCGRVGYYSCLEPQIIPTGDQNFFKHLETTHVTLTAIK